MYTLINGSPKYKNSNSFYFLNIINKELENFNLFNLSNDTYNNIIDSINCSDVIVLSFPLYVDSPPSIVLELMDYIYDNKILLDNKKIYLIINCGFLEGEQNLTAVNIFKNWCNKVNAVYYGAILIGAGEIVGKKKYTLVCKTALKCLNKFAQCVKEKKKCANFITTMDFMNRKIYCFLANFNWNKTCRKNGLIKSEIISK